MDGVTPRSSDDAPSSTFKPVKPTATANAKSSCHWCHTAGAKTHDFVYTAYALR